MIYFVVTPQTNRFAVYEFLLEYAKNVTPLRGPLPVHRRPPDPVINLQSKIRFITADDLLQRPILPEASAWIFTALDETDDPTVRHAWLTIERRLREADQRVLNAPSRVLSRFELLRQLHAANANKFQVHRVSDSAPRRYPVFIRSSRTHDGSKTGLLKSAVEVQQALEVDTKLARDPDTMIVEFIDTMKYRHGLYLYCKYSVMRIGDRYIPRHALFSRSWVTKTPDDINKLLAEEETAFLTAPIAPEITSAFDLAGIEYGRIDFGLLKGKPQIWEINLNPLVAPRLSRVDSTRQKGQNQSAKLMCKAFELLLT